MAGSNVPQPVTTPPSDLDHQLGYLQLSFIAGHYADLAPQVARKEWPHIDYLARLVAGEADVRRDRATKSECVPPFTRGVLGHESGRVLGQALRPLGHDHS
jgi:hypothetical protein